MDAWIWVAAVGGGFAAIAGVVWTVGVGLKRGLDDHIDDRIEHRVGPVRHDLNNLKHIVMNLLSGDLKPGDLWRLRDRDDPKP